jgi:hypothetical protein
MPYLPARVTSERCEKGCLGRGNVLQFSAPGSYGVSKELLDTRPEGYVAYHCDSLWLCLVQKTSETQRNDSGGLLEFQHKNFYAAFHYVLTKSSKSNV